MTDRTPLRILLGAVLAMVLPGVPDLAAQTDPDALCTDPEASCVIPTDPEIAALIVWVMGVDDGAVIYLTPEGVTHGRSCDGAAELVAMASELYARLPDDERLEDDLLWANPALTREVYAHAWATTLGSDRGNPINVVFSDFTSDPDTFQSRVFRGPLLAVVCPG